MIKYIGSKRKLLPHIRRVVGRIPDVRTVLDVFSGTSRVGHALKRDGYRVIANDHNAYAHALARCYVEVDLPDIEFRAAELIGALNRLPGTPGPFTETYCHRSRYLHPKNGARVEAIRNAIAAMALPADLEAVVLVSLLEAADRVDSTTGVQMAYLKQWAPRALTDLELRMPEVLRRARHGKGRATHLDALDAARTCAADLVYIDPPYNQHSYLGNYHVWESLVRWDHPQVYGIACKRIDCRERRSDFNSRRRILDALSAVVDACQAHTVIVSFNDEGYVDRPDIETLLERQFDGAGHVRTIAVDNHRYVGARIGIHNLRGEKVGTVGRLKNVEYLYIASRHDPGESLADLAAPPIPRRTAV